MILPICNCASHPDSHVHLPSHLDGSEISVVDSLEPPQQGSLFLESEKENTKVFSKKNAPEPTRVSVCRTWEYDANGDMRCNKHGLTESEHKEKSDSEAPPKSILAALAALWNGAMPEGVPRWRADTKTRLKAVTALWNEMSEIHQWAGYFQRIAASDFLSGRERPEITKYANWKVTPDWALKKENYFKVIEGKYDNRSSEQKAMRKVTAKDNLYE